MRRKWKSRKVETACLEMLNAACMHQHCREAVQKYCVEWLEEIVDQDPETVVKAMYAADPDVHLQEGSILMRRHSVHVQNLAAVVLAKLRVSNSTIHLPPIPPSSHVEHVRLISRLEGSSTRQESQRHLGPENTTGDNQP
jgi:hypothetical protein